MKRIPKTFMIMGHVISVHFRDDLAEECECVGRFIASRNLIEIQSGMSPSYTMATFWHEAMHAICTHMGMQEINRDESQIDKLGQGVAQIVRTMSRK